MQKKVLAVIFVVISLLFTLAACTQKGGSELNMTDLEYDQYTKEITWEKVSGAVSYEVNIQGGEVAGKRFSDTKATSFSLADEITGSYIVIVKAKSSSKTSNPKSITVSHVKKEKLAAGEIKIDQKAKILFWVPVENATGYTLRISGAGADKAWNVDETSSRFKNGRFEISVADRELSKSFNATIQIQGDEIAHGASEPVEKTFMLHSQEEFIDLVMSEISQPENGVLSWASVEGATGYAVEIIRNGKVVESATISQKNGNIQYPVDFFKAGDYVAKVFALGNEDLIFDSPAKSQSFHYHRDYAYADIITLAKEKLAEAQHEEVNIIGISENAIFYTSEKSGEAMFGKIGISAGAENFNQLFNEIDNLNLNSSEGFKRYQELAIEEELKNSFIEALVEKRKNNQGDLDLDINNINKIHMQPFYRTNMSISGDRELNAFAVTKDNRVLEFKVFVSILGTNDSVEIIEFLMEKQGRGANIRDKFSFHNLTNENVLQNNKNLEL